MVSPTLPTLWQIGHLLLWTSWVILPETLWTGSETQARTSGISSWISSDQGKAGHLQDTAFEGPFCIYDRCITMRAGSSTGSERLVLCLLTQEQDSRMLLFLQQHCITRRARSSTGSKNPVVLSFTQWQDGRTLLACQSLAGSGK